MLSKISILSVVMGLVLAGASVAAEDPVPLKNWPAPLYWQPRAGEAGEKAGIVHHQPFGERTGLTSAAPSFPTSPLVYVAITPCRLVDTRDALMPAGYGPPSMAGNTARTIAAPAGGCGVPSAQAYSVTVTVVPPGGAMMRWLTLYPTGTVRPNVATLNDKTGLIINNAAVVPTGDPLGSFDVYVTDNTDVVIDINGYYLPPTALALGQGTVSAPALTFGSDAATGLYTNSAGSVSIATGGASRVHVDSTGLRVAGNLDFSNEIRKGGETLLRADDSNTFLGLGASGSLAASWNTAFGSDALASVTSGGYSNTALGYGAGNALTDSDDNVAVGRDALGADAGSSNTAIGTMALNAATTGGNTAIGYQAGARMTTGFQNTFLGHSAGWGQITGNYNVMLGVTAGYSLTSGFSNTAIGHEAGFDLRGGAYNVMLGNSAGDGIIDGSYNIDIGAHPVADESATIRIGDSNQTKTFISGIRGASVTGGQTVQIDANGQLGSITSSRRFKQDIEDLSDSTETLLALRPVSFRYRAHGPQGPRQYGLIAEEVYDVSPELVGRDKDGEIDSVAYDKVYALMLKQIQEQQRIIERLESRLSEIEGRMKDTN